MYDGMLQTIPTLHTQVVYNFCTPPGGKYIRREE